MRSSRTCRPSCTRTACDGGSPARARPRPRAPRRHAARTVEQGVLAVRDVVESGIRDGAQAEPEPEPRTGPRTRAQTGTPALTLRLNSLCSRRGAATRARRADGRGAREPAAGHATDASRARARRAALTDPTERASEPNERASPAERAEPGRAEPEPERCRTRARTPTRTRTQPERRP